MKKKSASAQSLRWVDVFWAIPAFVKARVFDIGLLLVVYFLYRSDGFHLPTPGSPLEAQTTPGDRAFVVLRDPDHMRQWYVVPFLVLAIFIYTQYIREKRWSHVLLALSFFFGEFFNECLNALQYALTGKALWLCSTETALMITVGYTFEIAFFFAICPFLISNVVDGIDKGAMGSYRVPVIGLVLDRNFYVSVILGLTAVIVEMCLTFWGLLVWEIPWWGCRFPFLLMVGYSKGFYGYVCAYEELNHREIAANCVVTVVFAVAIYGIGIVMGVL